MNIRFNHNAKISSHFVIPEESQHTENKAV